MQEQRNWGKKYIYSVSSLFLWIFSREIFSCFLVHLVISLVWIKHTFWTCSVSSTAHLQYPSLLLNSPSNLPFWLFLLPSWLPDSKTRLILCVDLDDPLCPFTSVWCKTLFIKSPEFKLSHYLFPQWNFNYSVFNLGSRPCRPNSLTSAETLNRSYNDAQHLRQGMCQFAT